MLSFKFLNHWKQLIQQAWLDVSITDWLAQYAVAH